MDISLFALAEIQKVFIIFTKILLQIYRHHK